MNSKNVTLISLAASAVVLLIALVILQSVATPMPAFGGSMQARGGDYVATMSQIASDVEALYLLDARARTMGIYSYDNNTKKIELRQTIYVTQGQ